MHLQPLQQHVCPSATSKATAQSAAADTSSTKSPLKAEHAHATAVVYDEC